VKVTTAQIIAANPKMNPNVLIPGKKIFIPDPAAK
jgi:LysM repeat protein